MGLLGSFFAALLSPVLGMEASSLGSSDPFGLYFSRVYWGNLNLFYVWLAAGIISLVAACWLLKEEEDRDGQKIVLAILGLLGICRVATLSFLLSLGIWWGTFWLGFLVILVLTVALTLLDLFVVFICLGGMAEVFIEDTKMRWKDKATNLLVLVLLLS